METLELGQLLEQKKKERSESSESSVPAEEEDADESEAQQSYDAICNIRCAPWWLTSCVILCDFLCDSVI